MRRHASLAAAAAAALLLHASAAAGLGIPETRAPTAVQDTGLTVERIFGTADFVPEEFSATWRADGERWVTVERDERGRPSLWQVEAATGDREELVSTLELVPEGAGAPLQLHDFHFGPNGRRLLLFADAQEVWRERTKGKYWLFDLETRELRPLSREPGWQMFAKFSPDGERVAFVREHDLHVVAVASGEERALTTSGSETIINGTTDWVYEEELGLRDAFRWSPDGTRIAYWQFDQSPVRRFPYLVNHDSLYSRVSWVRYPKAGTENSKVRVGVVDVASGDTRWLDFPFTNERYIPRAGWVPAGEGEATGGGHGSGDRDGSGGASDRTAPDELWVQVLNRRQNRLELHLASARTGESRRILTEEDSAWVDVGGRLHWLGDGERFVWRGEFGDRRHLYLYRKDGTRVRQLTSGEWAVTAVHGVDEVRGRVYFTASREGPLTRSVMGAALDGSGAGVVAGGDGEGVHSARFSPDYRYFFDDFSTAASPPTVTLRRAPGGEAVRTLVDNAALRARLDSLDLRPVEFTEVEAADGTPLNAYVIRPADSIHAGRRAPLLMYVYGGPGVQTVMDRWGGHRHLWHQLLARKGVAVASVDNRGTGGRGRDFYKQTYLRLGQMETADQLAARRQLASRPGIDGDRTAMWGWSYGGYMTLNALLHGDGAFAAGVAVAPVTHWKFYDTIYTERYMRTPQENAEGYRKGSPLTYADRLRSSLLLVHGTGDDNVHYQNTVRMADALEAANAQFRLRVYPNEDHGMGGPENQVNLFGMITGFLTAELGVE